MGCDIHAWVEKRGADGKWALVFPHKDDVGWNKWRNERPTAADDGPRDAWRRADWDIDRNYNTFAILANVRNGRGFAGLKTGDGFEPILADVANYQRGWPVDCSPELLAEEGYIEHSPSWLTLAELNAYNWTGQVAKECGVVNKSVYLERREKQIKGAPDSWCGWVSGGNIKVAKETDPASELADATHVQITWTRTYADAAFSFYHHHLPNLNRVAEREGVTPENLRLVFYFDS
jgi:hypothetical protein